MSSSRLRIAYIVGQLTLGGAERQLYLLVRELANRGHRAAVITLHPEHGDYWEAPIRSVGADLYGISDQKSRTGKLLETAKILKMINPDIVHSWTFHTNFYAAVGGMGARVHVKFGSERSTEASSKRALGSLYKLQLFGLTALTTNNNRARDYLVRHHNVDARVVPNGVELPDLTQVTATRAEIRKQLNLPQNAFVVALVGALVPEKGFGWFLDKVRPLLEDRPEVHVLVVGDGHLRRQLEERASRFVSQKRILFTGLVAPSTKVFPAFDVLCLPSPRDSREGLPNVIMEAGAFAIPVVAAAVAGVSDLVAHEESGFVVQPEDSNAFFGCLRKLISSELLRRNMGMEGRKRMAEGYSVEAMAETMLRNYYEHISDKAAYAARIG